MDTNMDIDDILASIDRSHPSTSTPSSSPSPYHDLQQLTRFWVAERSAPEILPWPGELMDRIMDRIRRQITKIEDVAASSSSFDPPSLPGHHTSNLKSTTTTTTTTLTLPILQTDLSRFQFLIRSLLRARLSKLSKHALHYLTASPPPSSTSQWQAREEQQQQQQPAPPKPYRLTHLSPSESSFLLNHQELLHSHYANSFLGSFPATLRRLDDEAGGIRMIEGPDPQEVVFVRCLAGRFRIHNHGQDDHDHDHNHDDEDNDDNDNDDDDNNDDDDDDKGTRRRRGGGGNRTLMRKGQVWVVRWEGVRVGVERGLVELL